jgi:hypothetical protein
MKKIIIGLFIAVLIILAYVVSNISINGGKPKINKTVGSLNHVPKDEHDSICLVLGDSIFNDAVIRYETIASGEDFFIFENMIFQDTKLLPFLMNEKSKDVQPLTRPTGNHTLKDIKVIDSLNHDIKQIIIRFDAIDGWILKHLKHPIIKGTRDYSLRYMIANDTCLYYCGPVKVSESFDSFLFLKNSSFNFEKELFLFNLSKDTITSICRLYEYSGTEGLSYYIHTYKEKNNAFRCVYKDLTNDFIVVGEDSEEISKEVLFSFDRQGRVILK